MLVIHVCVLLISVGTFSESARILGVVPTPSYSHQIVFRSIWNALTMRGHDMVVMTTDPQADPTLNITEIDVSFAYDLWDKLNVIKILERLMDNPYKEYPNLMKAMVDIFTQELQHPEFQKLLTNETEYFDLVIVEYLFPMAFGLSSRFNCPYIGVVTFDLPNYYHFMLGNPTHPVLYPEVVIGEKETLNFWERLQSTALAILSHALFLTSGGMNSIVDHTFMEEQFGKKLPPLSRIAENVSMMFINENPAFSVRPVGPSFVLIGGGTHLKPLESLPQDLQKYLDSGKDGVIYFSLGTNVKSDLVSADLRKLMLEALKELPYKVLWKFDIPHIPDLSENVKIVEWVPQQDVLRHPNVKAFITQGGIQSMEEAIFSHVPIVGIPFIVDQEVNVKKAVKRGLGVYVNRNSLTKENFKEAILEATNNPIYKQKTIEISELSKDQPMTGLEKAVWWTEYVIRHQGARHLRSPLIDLPFYQYYLLDVLGFLLGVMSVILFVIYKIMIFTKKIIIKLYRYKYGIKIKKTLITSSKKNVVLQFNR